MELKEQYKPLPISLTLNKETRIVEAKKWDGDNVMRVYGIDVTTTHGNMTHRGTLTLRYVEGKEDYSMADVVDIIYNGMRGNGYAKKSRFRYVGFPK